MKRFRSVDNRVVEVVEHTLGILKRYPNLKVHIGTDSQNIGLETIYVTVIAYRFGIRGVHYIYTKEKVPLVRDMFTRLFDEKWVKSTDIPKRLINSIITDDLEGKNLNVEYWDGTYNNTPCPVGLYTYKIQFGFKETDNDQVISGNVNLIR